MFLLHKAIGYVYDAKHPEATKLEKQLALLKSQPITPNEMTKRARSFAQASVKVLQGDVPEAFKEAVTKGTGPLIQLIEAYIKSGFGQKMFIAESFDPTTELGVKLTKEGYYRKTHKKNIYNPDTKKTQVVEVTEYIVFISEFPAVSSIKFFVLQY